MTNEVLKVLHYYVVKVETKVGWPYIENKTLYAMLLNVGSSTPAFSLMHPHKDISIFNI